MRPRRGLSIRDLRTIGTANEFLKLVTARRRGRGLPLFLITIVGDNLEPNGLRKRPRNDLSPFSFTNSLYRESLLPTAANGPLATDSGRLTPGMATTYSQSPKPVSSEN